MSWLLAALWACSTPPPPPPSPVIHGVVRDPVGEPLPGVQVKVLKSAYETTTDQAGRYEVPYAPGAFQLRFSHERTTTELVKLDIYVPTRFPSDVVVLYPHPPAGTVAAATRRGTLTLRPGQVHERLDFVELRSTRSWRCRGEPERVGRVGEELIFTDDTQLGLRLARLGPGGLIRTDDRAPASVAYDGLLPSTEDYVGLEALSARRFRPTEPGLYAWTTWAEGAERPAVAGEACFVFEVEG